MTSQTREEIELLIDTISEHASTLDDFAVEESDEHETEEDREVRKLLFFNWQTLTKAIAQLNATKSTLQKLIDKN
ncbi:hypothetical protein GO730_20785 [Spirosoma sp. HMF3257]|uniref:Uncharacterized protein n=1 Tax=Spirosoma telluris TaxID=2183553 RepID=A0A327NQD4_9BACT|nr:hypothetical protein [Spirosoma telluris]RAI75984.1 hypothetical protein HMF3257_20705 [Spirosoma telluris]